jgi:predicted phage terminase large subunit-like protein
METEGDLLKGLLRTKLAPFIERSFYTVNPGLPFLPNWHIHAMAHQLERLRRGEIQRLIITVPPRHLKSHSVSVAFPAWLMGLDPTTRIVAASYGADLARGFSFQCRKIMEAAWYRRAFPGARLDPKRSSLDEIRTLRHGYRLATSVGGPLTGKGGNYFLIDDPLKASDAYSEAARNTVLEWYRSTLLSRRDNPKTDRIVIVAQRLHVEDLPGYLLDQGGWEHLNLPAIATKDQSILLDDGRKGFRKKGRLLHEERIDQAELDRIKQELGSLTFEAQYQQNPAPPEGNLVKTDWFERYDETPSVGDFEVIVQSWDTAVETGDSNDYTVCQTWGINGDRLFLLDVDRRRLPYPDLRKRMLAQQHRYGAKLVIIEEAGSGKSLLQDIRSQGLHFFRGLIPAQDKITRLAQQSAKIEARMVFLPNKAPWLEAFENELIAFPNGKHDDQVDALSQFLRALDYRPIEILPLKLYHSDRWLWAQSKEEKSGLSN